MFIGNYEFLFVRFVENVSNFSWETFVKQKAPIEFEKISAWIYRSVSMLNAFYFFTIFLICSIPEIGEDSPENNPLYSNDGLPEFSNITIEHCRAAIAKQTIDFETGIKDVEKKITVTTFENIFQNIFEPLERLGAPLDVTWGLSKTLYLGNSTKMPTASYLSIHERASWARASKFSSKGIYDTVKLAIHNKVGNSNEQNRILQKFALEGKLNGLELDQKQNDVFSHCVNKIGHEKRSLKRKLDHVTQQFAYVVGDSMTTREFPENLLKSTALDPNYHLKGPWKISLQPPIFKPVMEYCSDREIRWNLWQALVNRGTTKNSELATSLNVEEIRYSRREIANLLGYETFADMSMDTKMAGKVHNVHSMIGNLLSCAKIAQNEEVNNLYNFAAERGFQHDALELWDLPYWRRKQMQTIFHYTEENFKQYFPLHTVLTGLFQLCEKLFQIQIRQRNEVSAWHKDVHFYDVFDPQSSAPIAGFYFDPYARHEEKIKYSSGWMVAIQNKSEIVDKKPLCALIFNFDPPDKNNKSYLTYNEVKSLFHKFGHALQHLLTKTQFSELAGVSNIEWDTINVSGYLMTHWLFTKSVMESISSHIDTQESLPDDMFETLKKMDNHMAGLDLCEELYLSTLDLELHSSKDFWLEIMRRLWPEFRCFTLHKVDIHPCSFTPIFIEEWGAAYYCHTWSKMIAANIFSAFHEVREDQEQIINIGKRYRGTYLSLGGSVHPGQIFREFRGRDPSPKALLNSLGLTKYEPKE